MQVHRRQQVERDAHAPPSKRGPIVGERHTVRVARRDVNNGGRQAGYANRQRGAVLLARCFAADAQLTAVAATERINLRRTEARAYRRARTHAGK